MVTLGKRLKESREKKGFSQLSVAKKTGISNANISNYERDYRTPDAETLRTLAELYEVTLDYLIKGRHEENDVSLDELLEQFKEQMEGRNLTDEEKKQVLDVVMNVIWEKRNP